MDSFEVNKVAGAVLGTLLFAFGTGFLAELIYHPKPAGKAGYDLPEPQHDAGGGGAAKPATEEPIAARLASADADKGKGGTKACQGCHSFEKGGPNKAGPDLWDIVERPKGGHAGFEYSGGMKEKGGGWSYDDLDHFLKKPSEFIKGTKMAFQGISSAGERANVIAYLRTLSDSPKPLPAAEKKEEAKPADSKPAEGEKKPEEAKPTDSKPAEAKPAAEQKPAQAKSEADKPADSKPAEAQAPAGENKPAEGGKAGDAPAPAKEEPAKPAPESPKTEAPKTEEPKSEEPKAEQPKPEGEGQKPQ